MILCFHIKYASFLCVGATDFSVYLINFFAYEEASYKVHRLKEFKYELGEIFWDIKLKIGCGLDSEAPFF